MKRILCAALTLALVLGLCAAALAGYMSGDVGGVFTAQIEKAIGHGGEQTKEPLPKLQWQGKGPAIQGKAIPDGLPLQAELTAKYGSALVATILAWRMEYYTTPVGNRGPVCSNIVNWALENKVDPADIFKVSFGGIEVEEEPIGPSTPVECCVGDGCDEGCECFKRIEEGTSYFFYCECTCDPLCELCDTIGPYQPEPVTTDPPTPT